MNHSPLNEPCPNERNPNAVPEMPLEPLPPLVPRWDLLLWIWVLANGFFAMFSTPADPISMMMAYMAGVLCFVCGTIAASRCPQVVRGLAAAFGLFITIGSIASAPISMLEQGLFFVLILGGSTVILTAGSFACGWRAMSGAQREPGDAAKLALMTAGIAVGSLFCSIVGAVVGGVLCALAADQARRK